MSSAVAQDYEPGQARTGDSPLTITENARSPSIMSAKDIRLIIPYAFIDSDRSAYVGSSDNDLYCLEKGREEVPIKAVKKHMREKGIETR